MIITLHFLTQLETLIDLIDNVNDVGSDKQRISNTTGDITYPLFVVYLAGAVFLNHVAN